MADKEDPFDAAMDSLGDSDDSEESTDSAETTDVAENTDADPFDLAMEAMETDDGPAKEEGGSADPFEAAMNAMESGGEVNTATVESDNNDDPFAAALEIAKAEHKVAAARRSGDDGGKELDLDFLMEIKLNLTFEVGRTQMYISDLLSLGQGSVIELHRLVGEELELFVNGQLLATGEVVVVNEKFGARITKILSPEERINHLGPHSVLI